jgi:hypothetical protein
MVQKRPRQPAAKKIAAARFGSILAGLRGGQFAVSAAALTSTLVEAWFDKSIRKTDLPVSVDLAVGGSVSCGQPERCGIKRRRVHLSPPTGCAYDAVSAACRRLKNRCESEFASPLPASCSP